MRLSDRLALGRLLLKPWENNGAGFITGDGCALQIVNVEHHGCVYGQFAWDEADKITAPLPCNCKVGDSVKVAGYRFGVITQHLRGCEKIVHLFNHHVVYRQDWTFDQLIDWVRSVEPEEPAAEALAPMTPFEEAQIVIANDNA